MEDKTIVCLTGLICVTLLQLYAWYSGHNGTVFALTSTIIGGIIGYYLGWKKNIKEMLQEYVNSLNHKT